MPTQTQNQTRQVVRAYHDAWIGGDMLAASAYLADDFTGGGPFFSYDSPADCLASNSKFLPVVTGLDMISELYGDAEATLVYDVHTATPAGTIRTAEYFRLTDGRISSIILIFDPTKWLAMQTPAGP